MTRSTIHSSIPKTSEGKKKDAIAATAPPASAPMMAAQGISLIGFRKSVRGRITMIQTVSQLTASSDHAAKAMTNIAAPSRNAKNVPTSSQYESSRWQSIAIAIDSRPPTTSVRDGTGSSARKDKSTPNWHSAGTYIILVQSQSAPMPG